MCVGSAIVSIIDHMLSHPLAILFWLHVACLAATWLSDPKLELQKSEKGSIGKL